MADEATPAVPAVTPAVEAPTAEAVLDQVLAEFGGEPEKATESETPKVEAAKPEPVKAEPASDIEGARLRKGFAKLAEDRQKLMELQNEARAATQTAEQHREKAQRFAEYEADPAGFMLKHADQATIDKLLAGVVAMEKSPAERRLDEFEARQKRERELAEQETQTRTVTEWKGNIARHVQAAGEKYDLINSLGRHDQVVQVITDYTVQNSVKDAKGNIIKFCEPLNWDVAAQAVEETLEKTLEKNSKRWGKRTPPAAPSAPVSNGTTPAPKRSGTNSLSSVPVAETPASADEFPTDDLDERERLVLASLQ